MSASSSPTRWPSVVSASARLTEVVDLPTPPLPEATATIAAIPGMPVRLPWPCGGWLRGAPARGAGSAPGRGPPPARSAVSTAVTEVTPASAITAASQAARRGSLAAASLGSISSAKPTLPSRTTTPETIPAASTS